MAAASPDGPAHGCPVTVVMIVHCLGTRARRNLTQSDWAAGHGHSLGDRCRRQGQRHSGGTITFTVTVTDEPGPESESPGPGPAESDTQAAQRQAHCLGSDSAASADTDSPQ